MQTNNIDKSVKEKLQERTFQPSTSAWERLSVQLDNQPKQKKRGWFFYIGAAASILLLISLGFMFLNKTHSKEPIEIIVDNSIDTLKIESKIDKLIKENPVETVIVKNDRVEEKLEEKKEVNKKKIKIYQNKKRSFIADNQTKKEKNVSIAKVETKKVPVDEKSLEKNIQKINIKPLKQDPNSSIKINSDDLLYAVTHNANDVKAYYAKHNLTREDVLKTIKSELKKSNINVSPNSILAEVESTIYDDNFQNNFMKSLKRRVSDIATVIASRNN